LDSQFTIAVRRAKQEIAEAVSGEIAVEVEAALGFAE
jgi:hypothetical protein